MIVTIENSTPWDTEALKAFLTPLCTSTPIPLVEVALLRAQPGQKRVEQSLYELRTNLYQIKEGKPWQKVTVAVISPKRAAARTDLLDRMAQVGDLATHEIALPEKIVAGIVHAFKKLATLANGAHLMGDQWEFEKHFRDHKYRGCECRKPLVSTPLIRGNTKTRTAPPVDIAKLKNNGRWALEYAKRYREKADAYEAKAQKIARRIIKLEAKAWKAKGDGTR